MLDLYRSMGLLETGSLTGRPHRYGPGRFLGRLGYMLSDVVGLMYSPANVSLIAGPWGGCIPLVEWGSTRPNNNMLWLLLYVLAKLQCIVPSLVASIAL